MPRIQQLGAFAAGFALAAVLFGSMAIFAQSAVPTLSHPLIIDIAQAVPVLADLVVPLNGKEITATVPMTVDVALQVRIAGAQVTIAGKPKSQIDVSITQADTPGAGDQLLDSAGRAYTLEVPDDIELSEVQSSAGLMGRFTLIGRLRNTGKTPLQFPQVIVSLYNTDDELISVDTGFTELTEIPPGKAAPFRVLTQVPADDVAHYIVQTKSGF